jgi:hypothetical protein
MNIVDTSWLRCDSSAASLRSTSFVAHRFDVVGLVRLEQQQRAGRWWGSDLLGEEVWDRGPPPRRRR